MGQLLEQVTIKPVKGRVFRLDSLRIHGGYCLALGSVKGITWENNFAKLQLSVAMKINSTLWCYRRTNGHEQSRLCRLGGQGQGAGDSSAHLMGARNMQGSALAAEISMET